MLIVSFEVRNEGYQKRHIGTRTDVAFFGDSSHISC